MTIRSFDHWATDLNLWTTNPHLKEWANEIRALCKPENYCFVDGSEEEAQKIEQELIASKTFIPLNPEKRPHSFLVRSHPDDVARVEDRTFICPERQEDAGGTNNWKSPKEMKATLQELFAGCMRGRTMFFVPYCMGPIDSPHSRVAVQITDSPYVVASMRIMTRMGKAALDALGNETFVKCLHSVGKPRETTDPIDPWPCNTAHKKLHIAHFPESKEVWSFGSGYGGNALLNKKCFALRIASCQAREEGWLAEHMLIVGITNPEGVKRYFTAAFPSSCGKTNLAMLQASLPGWKVECVGDDIAWMHWGKDGRLYAINPEAGFFGVAPGTSVNSNPSAMKTIEKNTIFTNVAMTDDGDVWWEGMSKAPEHLTDWRGESWPNPQKPGEKAAHVNSRFTVSATQCPVLDPNWQAPEGVPIEGIIFGGRRSDTIPLVREATSWSQGVSFGATMTSETTGAAKGAVGVVRNDPFAMLPFCGYNMCDYFAHWLSMEQPGHKLPHIFYVNWFQKDANGKFIWPGFGDNIRVIKWCFERIAGTVDAQDTPIGKIPYASDLDLSGLDISEESMKQLLRVDPTKWKKEVTFIKSEFGKRFADRIPSAIQKELASIEQAYGKD